MLQIILIPTNDIHNGKIINIRRKPEKENSK
jgi:hypothetical protein